MDGTGDEELMAFGGGRSKSCTGAAAWQWIDKEITANRERPMELI
jgi:hypothetical protein